MGMVSVIRRLQLACVASVVTSILGCSSVAVEQQAVPVSRMAAGSRDVITAESIPRSGSVEEAIMALRPEFLRAREGPKGSSDAAQPVAYLDGTLLVDVGMLRQIAASSIAEIRFLRPTEASARFRRSHPSGAIVLTSRRVPE